MGYAIIVIVGLVEALVFSYLIYSGVSAKKSALVSKVKKLEEALEEKTGLLGKIESLYDNMVDIGTLRNKAEEYLAIQESLKAERGRVTITQAELEAVENRLRELEEIERELEASAMETQEEFKILHKKREELSARNQKLKDELSASESALSQLLSDVQMSAEAQKEIEGMRAALVQAQSQIDTMLAEIEAGNDQYFVMKKRYDALDIEYAQLYEKFSEAEAMLNSGDDN
ncbi:MAG: hypothetical protein KDD62_01650 [Bdellovibrionales bacterium]|nr:hypothetical protein [Bdellovibrionales bacterium]